MILQIPSTISKVTTMSHRSLRIVCDTQENLTDEQIGKIGAMHEKFGWFMFSPDTLKEEDLLKLPPLPERPEDRKSPSQLLYNVLYVYWKQGGEKGEFELFYRTYMEKLINSIKDKLIN